MANGKKKGNKNEREVAKWFKEWTGLEFTRVPSSGGLRWAKTDNITGDIVCNDPRHSRRFPLTVEAKSYKDINFEHIILNNKRVKALDFWQQAIDDAERAENKIPILFMRYNGMSKNVWFVTMYEETYKMALKFGLDKAENPIFKIQLVGKPNIVILNSDDLKRVHYKPFGIKLKKSLR